MSDNFIANAGSGGSTFAADDISSVFYPRVKISAGRDGTVADVATGYSLISAASTNATSLKASAGAVYSIEAFNINAAVRYLKLYNKASAPTVGSDTPVGRYAIPGATTGGGFVISFPAGRDFATGIAFALTTGITDADNTGVAASEILVNITYV